MNRQLYPYEPSHGKVTDLNVWRRILSDQEISDWQQCGAKPGEVVISWEEAELRVEGLETRSLDRSDTCLRTETALQYLG